MKKRQFENENEEMFDARVRKLIGVLSSRISACGIIFMIAEILQIVLGVFINFIFAILGFLNVFVSARLMLLGRDAFKYTNYVVARIKSVPILLYALVFGTVSGVIPALYYYIFIRLFIFKNRRYFSVFD